jgi:serine/threonine protein kinase, bacterial
VVVELVTDAEPSSRHAPRLGETLGPYLLVSTLGEGSMGVVFRAEHLADKSFVALKVLKPALAADAVYRQRFVREARVAAEVQHPHLVRILASGEEGGHHYLAVACVEGGSLERWIERHDCLPVRDVIRLVAEIAAGLDALHAAGIVHRDVKPANVMLDEHGSALLTDFGLAKGRAYTVLTAPGDVMGTLNYIAPELISGEEAGPPSDIYALGCLAYECLTGAAPFATRTLFEVAVAHLEEEPLDPCSSRDDLPPQLGWALLRALAKKPAERPSTATAYAHLLRAAAGA